MATIASPPTDSVLPGLSFPERRRFTRSDYHKMAEAGLIGPDEKVELLNGEIVPMSPIGPLHSGVTDKLVEFFTTRLGQRHICRCQGPQAADDYSEPEPDVQVLRRRDDYYQHAHPTAQDVALVVEVSQTTLDKDLGPKMRVYAAAGIVEYWVVDLVNRQLHVHTEPDPAGTRYQSVAVHGDREKVAPRAAADCELDLAWLFGPPQPS